MEELIQKYSLMLNLINVDKMSAGQLVSILKLAGKEIDPNQADLIVNMVKEAGQKLGTTNLFKILTDQNMVSQLALIAEDLRKVSAGTASKQMDVSSDDTIHVDSMITCVHCEGLNHIRSARDRALAKHEANME